MYSTTNCKFPAVLHLRARYLVTVVTRTYTQQDKIVPGKKIPRTPKYKYEVTYEVLVFKTP